MHRTSTTLTNEEKVVRCQALVGYTFSNQLLCLEAINTTFRSLLWQGEHILVDRNNRLAILGDSLLDAHLVKQWLRTTRSPGNYFSRCWISALTLQGRRMGSGSQITAFQ